MSASEERPGQPRRADHPRVGEGLLDGELHRRVLSSFRLQLKLLVMVVLIFAVLGVLVFMIVERIFDVLTPSIRHDLEWKARHGVIELSKTSELGVIAADRGAVAFAARELTSDSDVVAVAVRGREGRAVFSYGQVPFAWHAVAPAAEGKVIERAGLLVASEPIEIEGLPIGRVTLAVSMRRMSAGQQLRADILKAGGIGALLAFALAVLFVRFDIGPLLRLTADAFAQLERRTAEALESARVKSEFLANMSHEIRTPMNGIMGVTKLLLMMPMESKMRRYVEVIDSSARGLLTIINDVLDFSKLEAGKYEIRPTAFEPRKLVNDCATLFGERARERGLRLHAQVAANVPEWLVGDPDRIRQILDNLVGNAVKFTVRGEVSISAVLETGEGQRCLRVSVHDTGVGIEPEDQRRLFQAFTQVDGSSVRVHGGTGLGLAIVKRLVELMRGEVGVSSEAGKGSEFWVRIPVEAVASAEAAPNRSASQPEPPLWAAQRPTATAPVLVVDDNEINRMVAVEHLYVLGYEAQTANNGAEAVAAVLEGNVSLVLMDCQMPVMDGYTAARTIRERERELGRRRLPIIALTAHVLDGEREKVRAAGMDEHLAKPIQPQSLSALLAKFLGARPAAYDRPAEPATASARPQSAQPATPSQASVEPANEQGAELPAVLECSASIIGLFLRLAPAQLGELRAAVEVRDAQRARDQAHKFKGALYSVSAGSLAASVESLRDELAAADWAAVQAQLAAVERRFARLCDQLRERSASTAS